MCPSARSATALSSRAVASIPSSPRSAWFPRATVVPPTRPVTPRPVYDWKSLTGSSSSPFSSAAATIAAARGCSLPRSRLAARRRASSPSGSSVSITVSRRGRPSVRVPVLSTTRVSTRARVSRASASRTRTPEVAPRPTPTMIDMGVARPRAQGHAMMRTEIAATRAWAKRGSGPKAAQATKATAAIPTTAGTNQAATASASRCMGARLLWASATSWTMRARSVSRPTFSARMTKPPVPLRVAPVTRAPGPFSTGIGSPVTIDSSTALVPSRTTPSTGTFSPGRTRRRSPGRTSSRGTSASLPSSASRRAVFGARPRRARMAPLVRCARPQLQHLPQEDEGDDHRRRLEVAAHLAVGPAERGREDARGPPPRPRCRARRSRCRSR